MLNLITNPLIAVTHGCCMMAGMLGFLTSSVHAAQLNGQFNVTVNFPSGITGTTSTTSPRPNSAFCQTTNAPGSFGATVTVVCSTGALVDIAPGRTGMPWSPMHGGSYRYLFQASRDGNPLGTIDTHLSVGTVTSWRVVNLADRDYLELLVDW